MGSNREVDEGPQEQGEDEAVTYTMLTTDCGSDPTNVSMAVKDWSNAHKDVTDDVTEGSLSVSGDVITLKTIKSLTKDKRYRGEVLFTVGGQVFAAYVYIDVTE